MSLILSKNELVTGGIYIVSCPKFNVAVWNGRIFRGPAIVDGQHSFETAKHFDDGLPFGTVKPHRRVGTMLALPPMDGYNFLVVMEALSDVCSNS